MTRSQQARTHPIDERELHRRVEADGFCKGAPLTLLKNSKKVQGHPILRGRDEDTPEPTVGHDILEERRGLISHIDPTLVRLGDKEGALLGGEVTLHQSSVKV